MPLNRREKPGGPDSQDSSSRFIRFILSSCQKDSRPAKTIKRLWLTACATRQLTGSYASFPFTLLTAARNMITEKRISISPSTHSNRTPDPFKNTPFSNAMK